MILFVEGIEQTAHRLGREGIALARDWVGRVLPNWGGATLTKPKLLWANLYCLLDRSSGAALSISTMLKGLEGDGWSVRILGAANFDHPSAAANLPPEVLRTPGGVISVENDTLVHELLVTRSTRRDDMTAAEEGAWYGAYLAMLDSFQPDIVFYFGGQPFDHLIADEAKARGIGTVFYLVNGNYTGQRWARDVDLVLTDTEATAELYRERLGLSVIPVGKFIEPGEVLGGEGSHDRCLFVNPSPAKGAVWVALVAEALARRRPDIAFEVVEARGHWAEIEAWLAARRGAPRQMLGNVTITPNTDDMRPVYGRAKLLLAPSLWWESGARVLAEAMLNGIPAITTDRGGAREMVGDGGYLVQLPEKYYQRPYDLLPAAEEIEQLAGLVERIWSDDALYDRLSRAARSQGLRVHDLANSRRRLNAALYGRFPALKGAGKPL